MFAPCLYAFISVGGFCGRNRRTMGKIPVALVFIFIVWVYTGLLHWHLFVLTCSLAVQRGLCPHSVLRECDSAVLPGSLSLLLHQPDALLLLGLVHCALDACR